MAAPVEENVVQELDNEFADETGVSTDGPWASCCEYDETYSCTEEPRTLFGDLLVCLTHSAVLSRTQRNPRCRTCGYWQDTPGPCGEPCL